MGSRWITRGGRAGVIGGVLWTLWPFGTPFLLAGHDVDVPALIYAISLLIPAALIIVALRGLHEFHREDYGRLGTAGMVVSAIAVAAMGIGLSLDAIGLGRGLGQVSVVGHTGFMLGFFTLVFGSIALGIAIFRAARLAYARAAGLWLAIALPSGFILQILADIIRIPTPGEDFFFWVGLLAPYGIAWIVLGYSLQRTSDRADSGNTP